MRLATPALLLSALLVLGTGWAHAVPGNLDPSFGHGGVARAQFGSNGAFAQALALQPDGKIVVAGSTWSGSRQVGVLARFAPDGSLDPSLGTNGTTATAPATRVWAFALALQPDGKIVLAGRANDYSAAFALARYRADGTLDPSFGSGGQATLALGEYTGAYGLAIQPDGKIVVAGSTTGTRYDLALARINPNGTPDAGFGTNGVATTTIGEGAAAYAVVVQPDGKIVAAGSSAPANGYSRIAVARYGSDGSLDGSFGSGGTVTTPAVGPHDARVNALAVQPDGKIVAAGYDSGQGLAIDRLTRDGRLDSGFGSGGRVLTKLGWYSEAASVALQPDGKIVVVGRAPIGAISGFAVARYDATGSPDPTFGRNGVVVSNLSSMPTVVTAMGAGVAVQPDGKIVVGGTIQTSTGPGEATLGVARYLVTAGCRVPNVRHRRLAVAKDAIVRAGCSLGAIGHRFSTRVARGRVVSQRPRPGAGLPERAKVSLVVSKGNRKS
jgi:uncharacterized delta-60 repeat protein